MNLLYGVLATVLIPRFSMETDVTDYTITPAPGWEKLRDELDRAPGVALLLGATDNGKSTLARWLVTELSARQPVALVDADVGQSALCLPGTVGMEMFPNQVATARFCCMRFAFLGSASPAGIIHRLVETTARFVAACRERTPLVLVDTTGLITGELGSGLKVAKIRAVAPAYIIAIQREDECEPILAHFGGSTSPRHHRLAPSPLAQKRSPEARARARQEKLGAYFAAAGEREHLLTTERVELFRLGQPANLVHQELSPGTVLGLNHGEETHALGVVIEADKRSITLRTPLPDLKGINRVVFGDIVLE